MSRSFRGKLLVATPKLVDPNFERTVVYLCWHDEGGAFGLVLNRPVGGIDITEHLPEWAVRTSSPRVPFEGGPVQRSMGLGLARGVPAEDATGWTPVASGLGLVNLGKPPQEVGTFEDVRVFLGYAGWGAGQLEAEIADGAWVVIEPAPGDLFTQQPGELWREVLRRQAGDLAMLAFAPRDPRVN